MLDRLFPKQPPPRLDPQQLVVMYLDEIAGRMADQQSRGILDSDILTVGDSWTPLRIGDWLSIDIYNDGDPANQDSDGANGQVNLYLSLGDVSFDPQAEGKAPLKRREHISYDLGQRRYWPSRDETEVEAIGRVLPANAGPPVVYARTESGKTAQVRIFWKV